MVYLKLLEDQKLVMDQIDLYWQLLGYLVASDPLFVLT